jgi:hypothetical protein
MAGIIPVTGRVGALSAPTLPPEDEPPGHSVTAETFPVVLTPAPGPTDLRHVGPQSSPSRSLRTHHAVVNPRPLTAGSGRDTTEADILGGAQLSLYTQTDPRLTRRRRSTGTTGRTNVYVSFGAQQPQGATTNSAGPNPLTRVGSPLPYAKPRKRQRAISVKSGAYRTSARTPDHFTVLDAIPMSNPYKNNHTNNSRQDFMNPHAVPAAANATIAQRGTCTRWSITACGITLHYIVLVNAINTSPESS